VNVVVNVCPFVCPRKKSKTFNSFASVGFRVCFIPYNVLLLSLKLHQNGFDGGASIMTRWVNLQRSPDPLAGFKGKGERRRGDEKTRRESEEKEEEKRLRGGDESLNRLRNPALASSSHASTACGAVCQR